MKILALEVGGIASRGGATIAALEVGADEARLAGLATIEKPRALGAQLVATVDEVLQNAQWNLDELDAFAIGSGPGSWTSLRVGFATWKTWAGTLEKPLVPIPSFDALAGATQRAILSALGDDQEMMPHLLVTLAPARPDALYGKLFRLEDDFLAVSQGERTAPTKDLLDAAFSQGLADGIETPLLIVGAAGEDGANFLSERGEDHLFQFLEIPSEAVAVEIALLASYAVESGEIPSLEEAEPLYLAPSSAERALG